MRGLYQITLESTNESYIKSCVNNILLNLGLNTLIPWRDHPLYGSISTKGGVELKESEGQYSLILYGPKKSSELKSIRSAIVDTLKSGLEIKAVELLQKSA
jgi:hypothetical protein